MLRAVCEAGSPGSGREDGSRHPGGAGALPEVRDTGQGMAVGSKWRASLGRAGSAAHADARGFRSGLIPHAGRSSPPSRGRRGVWINSFVGRQTFTGLPPCVPLRPRCEATNAKAPKGASVEAGSLCSSVRGPRRGSSWPVGGRGLGVSSRGSQGSRASGASESSPSSDRGKQSL